MIGRALGVALILASTGCYQIHGDDVIVPRDTVSLTIVVRTDVPLREIDGIRVRVPDAGIDIEEPLRATAEELIAGVEVAHVEGLTPRSSRRIRLALMLGDSVFVERELFLDHLEDQTITFLLASSCAGVTCEDARGPECLGGMCVDPTCTPDSECCEDDDCVQPDDPACASVCVTGGCSVLCT